jgi:tetratricopeptide (TPR) repeat protein
MDQILSTNTETPTVLEYGPMRIESVRDLHGQFPDIDGYWGSDDLAAIEATIRSVVPTGLEGEWSPAALDAVTQLVRVQNLQGKITEAKETLELARKLIMAIDPPKRVRLEIRLLLEEGRHLCLSMMPAKAQVHFNQAWNKATEATEVFLAIEAAVMLSISQPPKYQNEWLQSAITLAEKTDVAQAKLWLAQLYLMDGWHAFDFRRFEDALRSFKQALDRPRERGEMTSVILIKWCIARVLRALGRTQEALEIQKELLIEVANEGKLNGHVFLEMAECLQLLRKSEEAKGYFEAAYKELSVNGWFSDNKSSELSRMQELYKKRY